MPRKLNESQGIIHDYSVTATFAFLSTESDSWGNADGKG